MPTRHCTTSAKNSSKSPIRIANEIGRARVVWLDAGFNLREAWGFDREGVWGADEVVVCEGEAENETVVGVAVGVAVFRDAMWL